MLKTGLASITFRTMSPDEVIPIVREAGLEAIEWASSVHVHEGDCKLAEKVRDMTLDSGIEVSSYGSYFRLGAGQDIEPFLESAAALGTHDMRIWGGDTPSAVITPQERELVVLEARKVSQKAAEYGIRLSLECHANSLTDSVESHTRFLREVDMPNFCTYWQALSEVDNDDQLDSIRAIYATEKLTNIHVYWLIDRVRSPLDAGKDYWTKWLGAVADSPLNRYALIEFVSGDAPESLKKDAKTLNDILRPLNNR